MIQREATHPSGAILKTPLLVPSFSSCAFPYDPEKVGEKTRDLFHSIGPMLAESFLVSSYDLFEGNISLEDAASLSRKQLPAIVDSGGYETQTRSEDYSAIHPPKVINIPWPEERMIEVYSEWPADAPAFFVSYDRYEATCDQITKAAAFSRKYGEHGHIFLLKPSIKGESVLQAVTELEEHAEQLSAFSIIGITEKELGLSLRDRVLTISQLRCSLNKMGLEQMPIHIFGSLDFRSIMLYLASGADIFDGLTWLRFDLSDLSCRYIEESGYSRSFEYTHEQVRSEVWVQNYFTLMDFEIKLRSFVAGGQHHIGPELIEVFDKARAILEDVVA